MPGDLISDPFSERRHAMLGDFANVTGSHDREAISAAWDRNRECLAGARGIFVVEDQKYELSLPDDQDFGGTGCLRCMMASTRLLNIQNSESAREFRYNAEIYCDTNFVSFCGTFFRGGNLGPNSNAFRDAVKFLLPIRASLNATPYLFENADNANTEKLRESLLGFVALKLTSPEEFQRRGTFAPASQEELERAADEALKMMRGPDFRTVHDQLVMEHYRWSRVILLKSTLIAFTSKTRDVESRMGELLRFLHEELARFLSFQIYVAFRFFSLNQKEPFFSGVQQNSVALDRCLKAMTWDLTHWRTLFDWTMITSRHSTKAAFPVPYFLSFDRRFIRLAETFKLEGLIYSGDSKRCEHFLSGRLLRAVSDLLHGPLGEFQTTAAIADRGRRVGEKGSVFDERLVALETELSDALAKFCGTEWRLI